MRQLVLDRVVAALSPALPSLAAHPAALVEVVADLLGVADPRAAR